MQLPRTSELQLQTTHRNLCSITLPQNSSTIVMDLEDQDLLLEDDEVEQDYTYFLRQYLEEEDRLEDDDGDGVVHLAEPSLHTYLGEIEDTRHRTAFLDGNSVVNLSRFRLQGSLLNGVQVTAQNPEKGGTFVTNRERVCHIKVIVYS
ncbi:uncharacterized protein LOC110272244 isoform X4 [Arachis ipaensis]|nr:uncharacterized protein LOC110272244 isoform X4 [Arachis ipaensis]QHO12395.1 uncharacterized protein DS421_15g506580 [Arachis hypogaea]